MSVQCYNEADLGNILASIWRVSYGEPMRQSFANALATFSIANAAAFNDRYASEHADPCTAEDIISYMPHFENFNDALRVGQLMLYNTSAVTKEQAEAIAVITSTLLQRVVDRMREPMALR